MNTKSISMAIATAALVAVTAMPASAQIRRNGTYRKPAVSQRTWQIRSLVDAGERSSNAFRDAVEDRDRNSNTPNRYGTSSRERFFNDLAPVVRRMDEAFEDLRRVADNNRPRAGRDEMTKLLQRARIVDRFFTGSTFGGSGWSGVVQPKNGRYQAYNYTRSTTLEARWRDVRRDINALAKAYNMTGLNARRGW